MVRICFVCLGNICRSPTAEGVMRHLVQQRGLGHEIEIESAGTGAWHAGEPPDRRSAATGRQRGIPIEGSARRFVVQDFDRFELVLAMDSSNLRALTRLARTESHRSKLRLFRDFDPESAPGAEVPDPYYGGPQGFDQVFDICEAGCRGLLDHLQLDAGG